MHEVQQGWQQWHEKEYTGNMNDNLPRMEYN